METAHVLTSRQQSIRRSLIAIGFSVSERSWVQEDGLRLWHCAKVIDGVEREFSVNLSTGRLIGWGCGTVVTLSELQQAGSVSKGFAAVSRPDRKVSKPDRAASVAVPVARRQASLFD
jgi:hypothetical protein